MFNNSANIVINGGTFVQNNTSLFSNIRRRPRGNDSHATDGIKLFYIDRIHSVIVNLRFRIGNFA